MVILHRFSAAMSDFVPDEEYHIQKTARVAVGFSKALDQQGADDRVGIRASSAIRKGGVWLQDQKNSY